MLIDDFLPEYDFVETHSIAIDASAAQVYAAANEVDFSESFIVRWLFRLRGMSGESVSLKNPEYSRFKILGETLNKELLIGLAGRFWSPWGDLQKVDASNFRQFEKPGCAKAVWNFSLRPASNGTDLTTETRISCLDDGSRRSFGFYWTFIQPFSGLIRIEMLKTIKRKAEMSVPPAVAGG
ncbi:hypothetical protein BH10ACI2_BH10ACI2_13190 [soil metagenome]